MVLAVLSKGFTLVVQAVLTVFYFVYFLFKGKPEWKCEQREQLRIKTCCVETTCHHPDEVRKAHCSTPSYSTSSWGANNSSLWTRIKNGAARLWRGVKDAARTTWRWTKNALAKAWRLVARFFKALFGFFKAAESVPYRRLSAPKPFIPSEVTQTSYTPVSFDAREEVGDEEDTILHEGSEFYAQRIYTPQASQEEENSAARGGSVPPPPPPPPSAPIRIPTAGLESKDTVKSDIKKEALKGGVPVFPPSVMSAIEGTGADWEKGSPRRGTVKTSVVREELRAANIGAPAKPAPWRPGSGVTSASSSRATSVGPSLYRHTEEVVSRIGNGSGDEAQFVFRTRQAPTTIPEASFYMGRSVYSPLAEAELMRDEVNRRASLTGSSRPASPYVTYSREESRTPYDRYSGFHSSRVSTPAKGLYGEDGLRRRSQTVGPSARENYNTTPTPFLKSYVGRTTTPTPFATSNTYNNNNTSAYSNGYINGLGSEVRRVTSQWPPRSNATGPEIVKDNWLTDKDAANKAFSGSIFDDAPVVTTMCKRVMERKVEDNWKWTNHEGKILDEKTEKSWRGELDKIVRDGPGEGRHWSRRVDVLPSGATLFEDKTRQYNNDYVVESIARNY